MPGKEIKYGLQPPKSPTNQEPFVSAFVQGIHEDFFHKAIKLLIDKSIFFCSRQESPFQFKSPKQLSKIVDISLTKGGTSHENLLTILDLLCQYSPHTSHPYYLRKFSSGLDPYGIAGDWLASTMSTVLCIYYASPVFTIMELELTIRLCSLVGFQDSSKFGGISTPGSSTSNIMAICSAIQSQFPDFKTRGFGSILGIKPMIFLSKHASSTFQTSIVLAGLSRTNLCEVDVDENGKMSKEHLREAIDLEKSKNSSSRVVMIIGTAGTEFNGSIDPLAEIWQICQEERCWFHVDGDLGAGALLSTNQTHLLNGIKNADSVTFGTWMLCLAQTTSFLLLKDFSVLGSTFSLQASVLYNIKEVNDRGNYTIQTSRRPDLLKLWYSWKSRGLSGLEKHVDKCYRNAKHFVSLLNARNGFKTLTNEIDIGIPLVSFTYFPVQLQNNVPPSILQDHLSKFMERLQRNLLLSGVMQLSLSTIATSKYLTISFCNSTLEIEDLEYIVQQLESFGNRIKLPFTDLGPLQISSSDCILQSEIEPPEFLSNPIIYDTAKPGNEKQFLQNLQQLFLKTGIFFENRREESPFRFREPQELRKLYDFNLGNEPMTHEELLKDIETAMKYCLKFGHPYAMYQLMAGQDPYSLIADYFVATLDTTRLSYEDSPVFSLMDSEVLRNLRNRVFGNEIGDGLVTDGGSMSNQIAISLAIQNKFRSALLENGTGPNGKNLKYFISEDGHFSVAKGAIMKGLGTEAQICVKTNALGKMILQDLIDKIETCIQNGDVPFLVIATTGTTVYGSIDPVSEITKICRKYNMWCHVDACFGGPLIFSDIHTSALMGIQNADSVAMDFHKMLACTTTTSVLISRHKNIIQQTFGCSKFPDIDKKLLYNKKFDCNSGSEPNLSSTRRNNLFKLWFLWKAKGLQGLGQHIDEIMKNSKYATKAIKARPGFVSLLNEFEITNVCFYFIPKSLRHLELDSLEFIARFAGVSSGIEKLLLKNGVMSIITQRRPSGNSHAFLKLVLMNSAITTQDIDYLLDQVEFFGDMYHESESKQ